jgi:hypothetical protein
MTADPVVVGTQLAESSVEIEYTLQEFDMKQKPLTPKSSSTPTSAPTPKREFQEKSYAPIDPTLAIMARRFLDHSGEWQYDLGGGF